MIIAHGLRVAGGKSVAINVIQSLAVQFPQNQYLIFVPDDLDYRKVKYPKISEVNYYLAGSFFKRLIYDKFELKRKMLKFNPDFIWGLGNIGLQNPSCFQAILFHKAQLVYKLGSRTNESLINRTKNYFLKNRLRKCLRKTQLVFCQTNVMAKRFRDAFNYENDIYLFPNAISSSINKVDNSVVKKIKRYYKGKTLLFVLARYYPHKNLELILNCFKKYREELNNVVCFITIEKCDHPNAIGFLDKVKEYNLQSQIVNFGAINQSEISSYYASVDALLLPTILESFSSTYVEAMRYKVPIITSGLDFAKEICGDAALYFDPTNVADLKDQLLKFILNPNVQNNLVANGKKQLANYNRDWNDIVYDGMSRVEAILNSN